MPPPSPLAIATGSVRRLLKEDASYHKELADQQAKIKRLEDEIRAGQAGDDGNNEYMLKQLKTAVDETNAVFEPLRQRTADAVEKLEDAVAAAEEGNGAAEEIEGAKSVLAQAKAKENGS